MGDIHWHDDKDWTVSGNGLTVYYTGTHRGRNNGYWWGTEDSFNILDKNDSTYIVGNYFTNVFISGTINFKIVPDDSFVATMRFKLFIKSINGADQRLIIKKKYKNQDQETEIYNSGKVGKNITYEETLDIYAEIDYFNVNIYMDGMGTNPYIYSFTVKTLQKSDLYGYDGSSKIQFLNDDTDGSDLKYKDSSGKTHNIFLCDASNPAASKFKIYTKNGVKSLGKC